MLRSDCEVRCCIRSEGALNGAHKMPLPEPGKHSSALTAGHSSLMHTIKISVNTLILTLKRAVAH